MKTRKRKASIAKMWGGGTRNQHLRNDSGLTQKLDLRAGILDGVTFPAEQRVYLAYAGKCDLAAAYPAMPISAATQYVSPHTEGYGLDRGSALKDGDEFRYADVTTGFPFADAGATWAVGDFDAWSRPYSPCVDFIQSAKLGDTLALFFTDTQRTPVLLNRQSYMDGAGRVHQIDPSWSRERLRAFYAGLYASVIVPSIAEMLPDYALTKQRLMQRSNSGLTYLGLLFERRGESAR